MKKKKQPTFEALLRRRRTTIESLMSTTSLKSLHDIQVWCEVVGCSQPDESSVAEINKRLTIVLDPLPAVSKVASVNVVPPYVAPVIEMQVDSSSQDCTTQPLPDAPESVQRKKKARSSASKDET
jgi:hypothetical protein